LSLLFLGYLVSFSDRIVFGLVLKPIKATLQLSDSQAGLVSGLALAIAYALFSPVGGYLVDRGPRRPIFALAVAFWSLATLCCGLAGSLLAMALARVAIGAGEAFLHPLAMSLISDAVPRESRPKAFAIYFSAGSFALVAVILFGGSVLGILGKMPSLVLPLVGSIQPYQALFMLMAIPGLLLAVTVFATMKEPPRQHSHVERNLVEANSGWRFLRTNARIGVALFIGFPFILMSGYALISWVFIFFDRVHGWPTSRTGIVLALTSGVSLVIGTLVSGHMISALRNRGYPDAALRMCLISGVMFTIFAVAALLAPTPQIALALLPIGYFFGYIPPMAAFTAMSEVLPPAIRARLTGLNTLAAGLITNSLGPFLVGFFSDHFFPSQGGIRYALITTMLIGAVCGGAALAFGLAQYRKRMNAVVATEEGSRAGAHGARTQAVSK
jgi:MFS family permease